MTARLVLLTCLLCMPAGASPLRQAADPKRAAAIKVADTATKMLGTCRWRMRVLDFDAHRLIAGKDDFARWLRGQKRTLRPRRGGPAMSCWEALYYAAHRAGIVPKEAIVAIYEQAVHNARDHRGRWDPGGFHQTIADGLGMRDAQGEFQAWRYDPSTTQLERGQIVYFGGGSLNHAMLATGKCNRKGEPLVISLHQPVFGGPEKTPWALCEVPLPYLQKLSPQGATPMVSEPQWERLARELPRHTRAEHRKGYGLSALRAPKASIKRNLRDTAWDLVSWGMPRVGYVASWLDARDKKRRDRHSSPRKILAPAVPRISKAQSSSVRRSQRAEVEND